MAESPTRFHTSNSPPFPSGWPVTEKRLAFACRLTDANEVTVSAGKLFATYITLSGMVSSLTHTALSLAETVVTGLADGDVIFVKCTTATTWVPENYVDDNPVSGGDTVSVYQRVYQPDSLSIDTNITDPQTFPYWRLVTFRDDGTYQWLEPHYEGDIHYTFPTIISQNAV